jgi:crotonobetainyl-CoA:carnitine CoA-transferase CaiB-like acyl-CoA transferase
MSDWCGARERDEALAELARAKIPAAPVLSPREALDDPQIVAAGLLQPMRYPLLDVGYPLAPHPVDLGDTPADVRRPPPRLGEHSSEILDAIGLSGAEIATLVERGVVRQAAPL